MHQPRRVLLFCLGLAFFSLVLEGGLFQLWSLHRDLNVLESKISKIKSDTLTINKKIERVSDPSFLELEVRSQLDYVEKGDLIFVFSDKQ
jgi:cell division protein FtsB